MLQNHKGKNNKFVKYLSELILLFLYDGKQLADTYDQTCNKVGPTINKSNCTVQ